MFKQVAHRGCPRKSSNFLRQVLYATPEKSTAATAYVVALIRNHMGLRGPESGTEVDPVVSDLGAQCSIDKVSVTGRKSTAWAHCAKHIDTAKTAAGRLIHHKSFIVTLSQQVNLVDGTHEWLARVCQRGSCEGAADRLIRGQTMEQRQVAARVARTCEPHSVLMGFIVSWNGTPRHQWQTQGCSHCSGRAPLHPSSHVEPLRTFVKLSALDREKIDVCHGCTYCVFLCSSARWCCRLSTRRSQPRQCLPKPQSEATAEGALQRPSPKRKGIASIVPGCSGNATHGPTAEMDVPSMQVGYFSKPCLATSIAL